MIIDPVSQSLNLILQKVYVNMSFIQLIFRFSQLLLKLLYFSLFLGHSCS